MPNTSPNFFRSPAQVQPADHTLMFLKSEVDSSIDLNVDGSITPVRFSTSAANSAQTPFVIRTLVFTILDTAIDPESFGGIVGGIANGLLAQFECGKSPNIVSLFKFPVTENWEFDAHMPNGVGNVNRIQGAATDDVISFSFNFRDAGVEILLEDGEVSGRRRACASQRGGGSRRVVRAPGRCGAVRDRGS